MADRLIMLGISLACVLLDVAADTEVVRHLEGYHVKDPDNVLLELPYHECVRNGVPEDANPGVCSMFDTHYASVPIHPRLLQKKRPPLTEYSIAEASDFCSSPGAAKLDMFMAMAVMNWTPAACAAYVYNFVSAELQASSTSAELTARGNQVPALDQILEHRYSELDNITASFGTNQWVEGNIWRLRPDDTDEETSLLQRKRRCLLTALQSAAGGPATPPLNGRRTSELRRVAEIGFNAGHSAASILTALPAASLTSFDICSWPYSRVAHEHLKHTFGAKRAMLVCGDSGATIPAFAASMSINADKTTAPPNDEDSSSMDERFDAMFIDGGHLYSQALADLRNSRHVVQPGALVVVDDCEADPRHPFFAQYKPVGTAWRHAIGEGTVVGLPDVCGHVALCIGHYPSADDILAIESPTNGADSGRPRTGETDTRKSRDQTHEHRLPPDESVNVILTAPKHREVLEVPLLSSSLDSEGGTAAAATTSKSSSSSRPVRSHVVISVAVNLGVGRAADAVRATPSQWRLCCQASHADAISSSISVDGDVATTTASTSPLLPPTCVDLGLETLPAVPLPGRSGPTEASHSVQSMWLLEGWLERIKVGERLGPRAVVGLTAIEFTG